MTLRRRWLAGGTVIGRQLPLRCRVALPEAEAAKFAVVPVATVTLTGCNLIIGALAAAPTVRFVCAFFIGPEVASAGSSHRQQI